MKRKIICILIVSIFMLMGFSATGSIVTEETNKDSDNSPPVLKYCNFEFDTIHLDHVKVIASDPDGDAIRFGWYIESSDEFEYTDYYTKYTTLGVIDHIRDMDLSTESVKVFAEDEHGAQSDWVDPHLHPRSKSVEKTTDVEPTDDPYVYYIALAEIYTSEDFEAIGMIKTEFINILAIWIEDGLKFDGETKTGIQQGKLYLDTERYGEIELGPGCSISFDFPMNGGAISYISLSLIHI